MRRMARPAAAKQVRMAPQAASESRSRRDQMLLPLSASGIPGFPPGIEVPSQRAAGKKSVLPVTRSSEGQGTPSRVRRFAARLVRRALTRPDLAAYTEFPRRLHGTGSKLLG